MKILFYLISNSQGYEHYDLQYKYDINFFTYIKETNDINDGHIESNLTLRNVTTPG